MADKPLRTRTLRRADVIVEVIGAVVLFAFLLAMSKHFGSLRSYVFFTITYIVLMALIRRVILRMS